LSLFIVVIVLLKGDGLTGIKIGALRSIEVVDKTITSVSLGSLIVMVSPQHYIMSIKY
jgi:hypothetical protein